MAAPEESVTVPVIAPYVVCASVGGLTVKRHATQRRTPKANTAKTCKPSFFMIDTPSTPRKFPVGLMTHCPHQDALAIASLQAGNSSRQKNKHTSLVTEYYEVSRRCVPRRAIRK